MGHLYYLHMLYHRDHVLLFCLSENSMSLTLMGRLFTVPWYNLGNHSLKISRYEVGFDLNEVAAARASKISNPDVDRHFETAEKDL
jgi:hypothetical protein